MFINLMEFPWIEPKKDAEFKQWFTWSNNVCARSGGLISRRLLTPTRGEKRYIILEEYESEDAFTVLSENAELEQAFSKVKHLFHGSPTSHSYEVVASSIQIERIVATSRLPATIR